MAEEIDKEDAGLQIFVETFREMSPPPSSPDPKFKTGQNEVKILVLGKTGSGKSSIINAMLGMCDAKLSFGALPTNHKPIECHCHTFNDTKVKAYDTRGFFDPDVDDSTLIEAFRKECPNGFDLILICHRMIDRIDRSSSDSLKFLTRVLGNDLWNRAIFVLTFTNFFLMHDQIADLRTSDAKAVAIIRKRNEIRDVFRDILIGESIAANICNNIPFVVAGREKEKVLPTTVDWLADLWDKCIERCRDDAKPFLSIVARNRAKIEIGAIGGVVATGSAIGSGVGSAVGTVFFPGIGTVVGAGVGAGIGAGVGVISAGVTVGGARLMDKFKSKQEEDNEEKNREDKEDLPESVYYLTQQLVENDDLAHSRT